MGSKLQLQARKMEILVGLESIGKALGCGCKSAKGWEREGAPIVRDERGVPRAEIGELWDWYKTRHGKAPDLGQTLSTPAQT